MDRNTTHGIGNYPVKLIDNRDGTYSVAVAILKNAQTAGDNTNALLAASASYTGVSLSVEGYARITGTVYSDQAGTLYIEQSPDGTNWDTATSLSVSAATATSFSVEVVAPYARLRYVNGATAQTVFRLYSFLRRI